MAAWEFSYRNGFGVIALSGCWLTGAAERPTPEAPQGASSPLLALRPLAPGPLNHISFDGSRLGRWDTTLVVFLWEVRRAAEAEGIALDDGALPRSARMLLRLLPSERRDHVAGALQPFRPLKWLGSRAQHFAATVGGSTVLAAALGAGAARLVRGRARLRGVDLVADLVNAGPRAVLIVSTVNFLIGAILAFIGAAELRQFSADAYVPALVGVAAVRELASVVTGIVMAGRTGGAYAARLASLRGNDEIAALRVLGIPINDFLLLPAVVSLCLAMPILYLIGCFVAIAGGLAVSTASLGFDVAEYLHATFDAVPLGDFLFGALKSMAFAVLIGTTSCWIGLAAARSARAVGEAATSAVVVNIVGIIALDALFAVLREAGGV